MDEIEAAIYRLEERDAREAMEAEVVDRVAESSVRAWWEFRRTLMPWLLPYDEARAMLRHTHRQTSAED